MATLYVRTSGNDSNPGTWGSPKLTLRGAFAAMSGGDTLIIGDGTYTGLANAINFNNYYANNEGFNVPPNGTAGAYTVIRAENEGAVTFDGQQTYGMFLTYDLDSSSWYELAYLEFHGIKWTNPGREFPAVGLNYGNIHHLKFFRCGAYVDLYPDTDPDNWIIRAYGTSMWAIETGHHLLFEECYAWGCGRYGWKLQDTHMNDVAPMDTQGASEVILRRCVSRLDRSLASANPHGNFMDYCGENVEFQNCIAIDTDPSYFNTNGVDNNPNLSLDYIPFYGRRHDNAGYGYARNCAWRGCLVINIAHLYTQVFADTVVVQDPSQGYAWVSHTPGWTARNTWSIPGASAFSFPNESATLPNTLEHCVVADAAAGLAWASAEGNWAGSPIVRNLTILLPKVYGTSATLLQAYGAFAASASVPDHTVSLRNSLVVNLDDQVDRFGTPRITMSSVVASDYCAYWTPSANVSDFNIYDLSALGAHDYSKQSSPANHIDPYDGTPGNGIQALKYLCRVETGSNLNGTGEGGADRAATVIYCYGVSGTLWGETGYNTLTSVPLWPFPYEAQIRADLRTYSDSESTLSGARGFCANNETLTNYIWNYLGNGNPYAQPAPPSQAVRVLIAELAFVVPDAAGASLSASPSMSPSSSASRSASRSPSASVSRSSSASPSASASRSASSSPSKSASSSASASASRSPSTSVSVSPSTSASASPSPSASESASPSTSFSGSSSESASPSTSPSTSASSSPSTSISASPSVSPSRSSSTSASASASRSPSTSASASPSRSASTSASRSASTSPSRSGSASASTSPSGSQSPSQSPSASASRSASASASASASPSAEERVRKIKRRRQSAHLSDEQVWLYVSSFQLDLETGARGRSTG